jgi:hypothetical protein
VSFSVHSLGLNVEAQAAYASCKSSIYEDHAMKIITTLTLATLLLGGSAFAADSAPTSKPAAATTATKPAADHHCRDDANAKKLAGAARKSFMKKCLADSRAAK